MQYLNLLCAKLPTAVWIGVPGVNTRLSQIPLQAQVQFYNPGGEDQSKDLFAGLGVNFCSVSLLYRIRSISYRFLHYVE